MKNYSYRRSIRFSPLTLAYGCLAAFSAFVFVLAAGVPGGLGEGVSNGSRTGTITKVTHSGLFIKSFEGEMNMGGLKKSTSREGRSISVANTFEFSVNDPAVLKVIEEALDSGDPIKLTYTKYFIKPFEISTWYVITKAEIKH